MISGIILASGFSRRMTQDKLLLPVGGIAMIERVVRSVVASKVEDIVLVYRNEEIVDLVGYYGIKMIHNPLAEMGQSEAVKIGLKHIAPSSEACFFFMGDQPYFNDAMINAMIETWREDPAGILVPLYPEAPGSPVVFPRHYYHELSRIQGDRGGKSVILEHADHVRYTHITNRIAGIDVDTEEDYRRLLNNEGECRG